MSLEIVRRSPLRGPLRREIEAHVRVERRRCRDAVHRAADRQRGHRCLTGRLGLRLGETGVEQQRAGAIRLLATNAWIVVDHVVAGAAREVAALRWSRARTRE